MSEIVIILKCGGCGSSLRTDVPAPPDVAPGTIDAQRYVQWMTASLAQRYGWTLGDNVRCEKCGKASRS